MVSAPNRALVGAAMAVLAAYYKLGVARSSRFMPVQEGDAIVVTGSHSGIGKHAALSLAREGFTVFACVRKLEHGDELVQEAAAHADIDPSKIKPLLLDVTNSEQISQAVETVSQFVGDKGLYGLFNNAGIGHDVTSKQSFGTSMEHLPLEQTRSVFEVNYFGLLQVTKAFLPLLRSRRGRIVNNASASGFFAGPFFSTYAASKYAVEGLSDSLRRELDPHGVYVSVLEAGYVRTPILLLYQDALNLGGKGVYAKHEAIQWKHHIKSSANAPSPRVTSQAVIHAMRATNPQTRYVVGGHSGLVWFLSMLPDKWLDAVLRAGRDIDVPDEELQAFIELSRQQTDFEL